jgi:hypothetical protein
MNLKDYLKTSEHFRPYGDLGFFIGNFHPDIDDMNQLKDHYLKTGENLIDDYVRAVWDSWLDKDHPYLLSEEKLSERALAIIKLSSVVNLSDEFISSLRDSISAYSNNLVACRAVMDKGPRRRATAFTSSAKTRREIFSLYGEKCLCCGSTENLTLDHINPVKLGGKNSLDNLQPLCKSCNSKKGTKSTDYRPKPVRKSKNISV